MSRFRIEMALFVAVLCIGWTLSGGRFPTHFVGPHASADAPVAPASASAPLALTTDGYTLLVVNPDSDTISLIDTAEREKTAEIPVGVEPRSVALLPGESRALVANQGSDTLSVVDLTARRTVATIPVGDRPVSVAVSPDGRLVAVAELGDDVIRLLDGANLSTRAVIPVDDRPHGLAFTPDGRLLVTHLLSGQVSVIALYRRTLFAPLIVKSSPRSRGGGSERSSEAGHPTSRAIPGFPVSSIPTWPHVAPAPAVLVNRAGTRAYLPQTMANGRGLNTGFDTTVFPKVSVLNLETDAHQTSEHIPLPETDQPVGLPWAVALARDDTELWVVNAASNDVSVVDIHDPDHPRRLAHISVGSNPRGVVISPDGATAYINNTLDGTVSVIDAETYTVTAVITVTHIPLPPALLHGKRLFYSSARSDLSRARWISCNTCHIEGEHDGRTWLLQYTGAVPVGAAAVITRNTTSLLGMIETYPLRWSAEWDESADLEFSVRFEQFGSGLIHDGEMHPTRGAPNQGRSYDLDCLAAFIDSLRAPERTHTLTPAEKRGKVIFESDETGCADCHPVPLYTDLKQHDVGTADAYGEWFGPLIDTPTLRFLYDSAPYLHDGSAVTLRDVLTTANPHDAHGVTSHLSEEEIADLVAFLLALPYSK